MNESNAIAGRVEFVRGPGGHTEVELTSTAGRARVSLYGGQVLSWQPQGASADVLFLGDQAQFQTGKAIRGGVPLCWPWFGPDPEGLGRPNHGFARTSEWRIVSSRADTPGCTNLVLGLGDDAISREIWPHQFDLQLAISLADTLSLELTTCNTGSESFTISQALHTYFRVGDIDAVEVVGLDGAQYLDKVDNGTVKYQQGSVIFGEEVDRIYQAVSEPLAIRDSALDRALRITARGGSTAIIWNPWEESSGKMADLAPTDYRHFVCVETANAEDDIVVVSPGGEHRLKATYQVEELYP